MNKHTALALTTVLVVALFTAGVATAGDYVCKNQTLGAITITGNLIVPGGAFCDINGTHVAGNAIVNQNAGLLADVSSVIGGDVTIAHGGQFAAFGGSTVGGNVACNQCRVADLHSSTVNGNLTDNGLTQGAFISNSTIGGTLSITDSFARRANFQITGNRIGANLEFNDNKGASNISNNTIAGTLACSGNTPPPTGSGNTALSKTGQCATL